MNKIESKDNAKIKLIHKLKQRKYRDEFHQASVEGLRNIVQALDYGAELSFLLFSEEDVATTKELAMLLQRYEDKSYIVKRSLFEQAADTHNTQGVLGVFKKPNFEIEPIIHRKPCRILLLDKVQDPGNIGTMIRTAEAAGLDAILCTKGTVDVFSDKVTRSSMSANFYLPIFYIEPQELDAFKQEGFELFTTVLNPQAKPYHQTEYGQRYLLAFGNEANGVSEEILERTDHSIYIPMKGKAESLNVATASAVVIYKSIEP